MSYSIYITEAAANDLDSIYEYISESLKEPVVAANLLSKLEAEINSLNEMPFRFRKFDEEPWVSKGMRIMLVESYVVLYTSNEDMQTVTINRVMYGGRDVPQQI